ncbi:MAG: sensor histidine kinase [Candidatus Aminicenantes bacterium]|nr:MAG: sensor histidine kinase [Candidatus Aminicenantes bacterium]
MEKALAKCEQHEILLREIHHRARNNMQIISSLLRIQSKKTKEKELQDILRICQNRIRSMSLIHEKFSCSKDLAKIELAQYIHDLAIHLFHSHGVDPDIIKLNSGMEDIQIDINRAIPIGLIVNELITNSLRHAFPDGKKGEIQIKLHPINQGKFEFVVKDNGVGFPKDSGSCDSDSLGMQLVNCLVEQIDGNIELHREGGTQFKITF